MPTEEINFKILADTASLKRNLSEVDAMFEKLDLSVAQHANSISRTIAQLLGSKLTQKSSRTGGSALEQLAKPLLNQVFDSVLGSANRNASSSQAVNIAMNIATPDANSFRMSQGQVLAEAAAAIARATKRYL